MKRNMKRNMYLTLAMVGLLCCSGWFLTLAAQVASPESHIAHENHVFPPDTIPWGPASPFVAAGAQLAVLEGNPDGFVDRPELALSRNSPSTKLSSKYQLPSVHETPVHVGLLGFAVVLWKGLNTHSAAFTLSVAATVWFLFSYALWTVRASRVLTFRKS
jgi:hypothetical protein